MPDNEPSLTLPGKPPVGGSEKLVDALVRAALPPAPPQQVAATQPYVIEVESTDTLSRKHKLNVVIDNDVPVAQWGVLQRAAVAKSDIKNPWSKESIPTIMNAIVFAERMGLSFELGDVFIADGRLSLTAKARMKQAFASGVIKGYTVETTTGPEIELAWRTFKETGVWKGPDYHVKVTVKVKNWDEPVVYEADLHEWFTGSNPNWRTRPKYMLELNAIGHALERVSPAETNSEEAPPNIVLESK